MRLALAVVDDSIIGIKFDSAALYLIISLSEPGGEGL